MINEPNKQTIELYNSKALINNSYGFSVTPGFPTATSINARGISSSASYDDLTDRAGIGFWKFELETKLLKLSSVSCRMTQFANRISLGTLMKRLHPMTARTFLNDICLLSRLGSGFEHEAHLLLSDGSSRWFRVSGILEQTLGKDQSISGVIIDITEAKLAGLKKADFIASMCHEMKTPLTILKMYVQSTLKFLDSKSAMLEANLQKADNQISVINKLIDSYMSSALSEDGNLILNKGVFDFSELVYDQISSHTLANPDYVIKFDLNKEINVFADPDKLIQVISNLLGNAIKFSPPHSFISVACEQSEVGVVFTVTDQGMGIPESDQAKLFSKYFRSSNARTGTIKGHGLGLFLCKEIVEAHNGSIFMESSLGMGSVFGFVMPNSIDA